MKNALDELREKATKDRAIAWRELGMKSAYVYNALSSFLFGYIFVLLLPSDYNVLNISLNGVLGGIVVTGLTDIMARVWDNTQLRASDSHEQIRIAKWGYTISFFASVVMTVVYNAYALNVALDTEMWLTAGKWSVPVIGVIQVVLWNFFNRASPEYKTSEDEATSNANLNDKLAVIRAKVLVDTQSMVETELEKRVPQMASEMADKVVSEAMEDFDNSIGKNKPTRQQQKKTSTRKIKVTKKPSTVGKQKEA